MTSKAEPGQFSAADREILAISCLSRDRSYAVRTNGMVFSIFRSNESERALRAAVERLPETGFLQSMRYRWGEEDRRFLAISFPFPDIEMGLNPLEALRLKSSLSEAVAKFHAGPNQAFEQVLEFRAQTGLSGENLLKVGGENLAYGFVGKVEMVEDSIRTCERILGARGFYRAGAIYGAALDITAFSDLKGEIVPEGAFFSSTTIRRVGQKESDEVRVNTLGSRMFSGHLKREVVDRDEIMKFSPYAVSHTVVLLDPSHKLLRKRVESWARGLLASGVATTRPQLQLLSVLKATLPGQGDLHPSGLYLDRETCADFLVNFQGSAS